MQHRESTGGLESDPLLVPQLPPSRRKYLRRPGTLHKLFLLQRVMASIPKCKPPESRVVYFHVQTSVSIDDDFPICFSHCLLDKGPFGESDLLQLFISQHELNDNNK